MVCNAVVATALASKPEWPSEVAQRALIAAEALVKQSPANHARFCEMGACGGAYCACGSYLAGYFCMPASRLVGRCISRSIVPLERALERRSSESVRENFI